MDAIARSGLKLGVDPMGGAALAVWDAIAKHYGLDLEVVNRKQDPDFAFMPPDHDGKIRMDCSSTAAMANLLTIKRSEEHTSELQSRPHLVCRLLLEKKNKI